MLAIVVVAGATAYRRWDTAVIHGASPVFVRTTADGVTVTVERGDVRWHHLLCGDGAAECVGRGPGIVVTSELADGRRGAIAFDDATFRAFGPEVAEGCPARLVTMAGLGIAPGSSDEQFTLVVTDASVASVAMTRPDGSVDEMTPVDGVAVLATRSGWGAGGHPRALAADGRAADVC